MATNGENIDAWFTPSAVWEVKGADFQVNVDLYSSLPFTPAELETQIPIEGSG
jgi:hypothetical protein